MSTPKPIPVADVDIQQPSDGRLAVNQMFGKYRVVRDLGAGGMAQVFLAALDGPDGFSKTCVIKRILPEYAQDESYSQMFVHEAKVAAMMSHPNIAQVFEFSKENGSYYLVMEYVSGTSLDRLARAARKTNLTLGPRVATEVGIGIANALAYAHSFVLPDGTALQLVHRDVTPGNVLISREGSVKLADFGVVKSSMTTQQTAAGVVKGKFSYMSPEQISGGHLDHRSDIFSLGIILFEVSTGRRLFKADSFGSTVLSVLKGEIPPPSQLIEGFPPKLERIIMKALARDLNTRYQSANALAADLEAFRASQPWTSGSNRLATLVNTLFPKEQSGQGPSATLSPGSGPSQSGLVKAPEDDDDDAPAEVVSVSDIHVISSGNKTTSPLTIAAAVAAALLGSALFWFLVL